MKQFLLTGLNKYPYLFSLVAGLLACLGLPPVPLWPVPLLMLALLIYQLEKAPNGRQAFLIGWLFGLGYFVAGLYWIGNALLIDSNKFWWMVPFAVIGLPAYLALFTAASTWMYHRLFSCYNVYWRPWIFAACWVAMELARAFIFGGFPWNLIGYIWAESSLVISQFAFLTGIYGVGFLTCLMAGALYVAAQKIPKSLKYKAILPIILATAVIAGFGSYRLYLQSEPETLRQITVRLVQPNIPQEERYFAVDQFFIFREHYTLSEIEGKEPVDLLVWPESSVPFPLNPQNWEVNSIASLLKPGAIALVGGPSTQQTPQGRKGYNSLYVINDHGEIADIYRKVRLVPFGEFVPLSEYLPIDKVTRGQFSYSPGDSLKTIDLPGIAKISPLICYEVIFSGDVVANGSDQPHILVNITDDSWYGLSSGPFQHYNSARFRSIEENLPLIRVANTGVSGVFDNKGRTMAKLPLKRKGVLDQQVEIKDFKPSIYSKVKNFLGILLYAWIIMLFWQKKRILQN